MRHGAFANWTRHATRPRTALVPRMEGLETRLALSTASPAVEVTSATTEDSRSVIFEYDVNSPSLANELDFGVYRSADATFDADDQLVASVAIDTTSLGQSKADDDGLPASAPGHHRLTVPVPGGFGIEPEKPFVLVVANPSTAVGSADLAARTGTIHYRTIAVVTHGGLQDEADDATGPLWQRKITKELTQQGYNVVVKYVWAKDSRHPGKANEQAPKLARMINRIADNGPDSDPVSIHFIGHSEGTVVNSLAAQLLQVKESPNIERGYIKMTMLDPHSANNAAPGYQYSTKNGIAGRFARSAIRLFQWDAQDPIASVPKNVDDAEVFWQHTRVEAANVNHGLYNLWGQVPVRGEARYYDITGPGISHTGDFGVQNWYRFNVIPTLGQGGNFVDPTTLTGERVLAKGDHATKWLSTATTRHPQFAGTATPGATITLFAAASGSYGWKTVGQTHADATTGAWSVRPKLQHDGQYRFVARSAVEAFAGHPNVAVTPRLRLGAVSVRTNRVQRVTGHRLMEGAASPAGRDATLL